MTFNVLNVGFDGTVSTAYVDRTGYISDGDNNDVFYYLGTNFDTTPWADPSGNGQVTTSFTDFIGGAQTSVTDNATTLSGAYFDDNPVFSYVTFQFTNCVVSPSRISEHVRDGINSGHDILNRQLEGSNNGSSWTVLSTAANVAGTGFVSRWVNGYTNLDSPYYSYLRLRYRNEVGNSNGARLNEIKLYGRIRRLDGGTAQKVSPAATFSALPDVDLSGAQDGDVLIWDRGRVSYGREIPYRCTRFNMTGTVTTGDTQTNPNTYSVDPNGANRNFDLPVTPFTGQYFRVRNRDIAYAIAIREPGPTTVATIGGGGPGAGLTQAEMWYDGTEWQIITS